MDKQPAAAALRHRQAASRRPAGIWPKSQSLPFRVAKPAVWPPETCRFAFQNDPFRRLERAVSQAKTARSVTPLIISHLQRGAGGFRLFRRKPAFRKFAADVHFDQAVAHPARAGGALLQFVGELHAVQRLDQVRLADEVFDLVRLQMADKVSVGAVHGVVFGGKFLHFVLADVRNARGDGLVDLVGRARLGGGDERDLFPEGVPARNFGKGVFYVFGDHEKTPAGLSVDLRIL